MVRGVALETGEIWRVTIGQGADGEGGTTPVTARRFGRLKHECLIIKKSAGEKESKPAFKIFFYRNSDLEARQTSYI